MPLPAPVTMATRFIQAPRHEAAGRMSAAPPPSTLKPSELDRKVRQVRTAEHVISAVIGKILRIVVGREQAALVGHVVPLQAHAVPLGPIIGEADVEYALGRQILECSTDPGGSDGKVGVVLPGQ